jgi:hypothetical protein
MECMEIAFILSLKDCPCHVVCLSESPHRIRNSFSCTAIFVVWQLVSNIVQCYSTDISKLLGSRASEVLHCLLPLSSVFRPGDQSIQLPLGGYFANHLAGVLETGSSYLCIDFRALPLEKT